MSKREPVGNEYINHYNLVRGRIVGVGNLNPTLHSTPDGDGNTDQQVLLPFVLTMTEKRTVNQLANFKSERAQLELSLSSEVGNHFKINSIMIFYKAVETSYPM